MKKLLTIPILLFTLMFSSTAYAEWSELLNDVNGKNIYIDLDKITKQNGYIYWSTLADYHKQDEYGDLSHIAYQKGDCKLFRFKHLNFSFYKEPMGVGENLDMSPSDKWRDPSPDSIIEYVLNFVCSIK